MIGGVFEAVEKVLGFTGRIAHRGYLAWLAVCVRPGFIGLELDRVSVPHWEWNPNVLLSTLLITIYMRLLGDS